MNKEMTIVWHDLIEDPNDLPPISRDSRVWSDSDEVFVQTKYGFRFQAMYRRPKTAPKEAKEGVWVEINKMNELNEDDIVAWTYIPRYRNREKRIDDLLLKLPVGMVFHRIKETDRTNEYPKPDHIVIVFKYDESKDSIITCAGLYDRKEGSWKEIQQYLNNPIDDVIGWSPFFKVNDNSSDYDKEKEVTETIKDENKGNKNLSFPNYKTGYLSDVGSELYRKSVWNKFYNNDKVIMKPHIHNLMENPNDIPTKKSCDGVLIFAFSIPRNENIITFPGWYDETNGVWKRSCNNVTVPKDTICGWADFQIYEKVAESKMFENISLEVTCPRETSGKDEVTDSDEKEDE